MAIGKEIGEFSLKSITTSYSAEGGSVELNLGSPTTKMGSGSLDPHHARRSKNAWPQI